MPSDITVIIPSIPPRAELLQRACASVLRQTLPPDLVTVSIDVDKRGAPFNRDRALETVQTSLVAPLDDDDELLPQHLQVLHDELVRTDADLVYPWYSVVGGTDPFPFWENQPWDNLAPHQVPVTFLARVEALAAVGGFAYEWDPSQGEDPGTDELGNRAGEDYRMILRLVKAGLKIVHLPQRTWQWHHDSGNTMGLPSRW